MSVSLNSLHHTCLGYASGETSFPCGRLNMPTYLDYNGAFVGNLKNPGLDFWGGGGGNIQYGRVMRGQDGSK
jgi:hypothetical protein